MKLTGVWTWGVGLLACFVGWSTQAGDAVFQSGRLWIPAVNTQQEVAKYQNVVFTHIGGDEWRLLSFDELGSGIRLAPVRGVSVRVTESVPAQVLLRARGAFSSGCGELGGLTQRRNGNRFTVVIGSTFWAGPCTMGVVPFSKIISLPAYGLSAGSYEYNVNGIVGTFELARDNVLPEGCSNADDEWCAQSGLAVDWTIAVR